MKIEPAAGSPESAYKGYFFTYGGQLAVAKKERALISNARLAVVVVSIVFAVLFYRIDRYVLSGAALIVGLTAFIALALRHATVFKRVDELSALTAINEKGLRRVAGTWSDFSDSGADFVDSEHPYTSDLDIFGKGSLYQHCTAAHTYFGREQLAKLLRGDVDVRDKLSTVERQEAVVDLAERLLWRQQLEGFAATAPVGKNPEKFVSWGEAHEKRVVPGWVTLLVITLQVVTGASVVVGLISRGFWFPLTCCVVAQTVLALYFSQHVFKLFDRFESNAKGLAVYSQLFSHIASGLFTAPLLVKGREQLRSEGGAIGAIKRLTSIIAASEVRYAPVPWLIANSFFLWDIRCAIRLEKWKHVFGMQLRGWLKTVGTFEALSSIATIAFENPSWCMPQIDDGAVTLAVTGMGHPLIAAPLRVTNDFTTGSSGGAVAIITGSNMSGKSTFLRSIGCNLVLAYAGSPVCATSFTCGVFAVYTSMRTGDELLSHTSTFYAELLRVKKVVDAVKSGEPVVYLLDELFRGTNSADRHDGAVALLKVLATPHTLGCVATHDMELCNLAEGDGSVHNYHFREWYERGEIRFDYHLQEGPSTTRNARYLMQMAGIVP